MNSKAYIVLVFAVFLPTGVSALEVDTGLTADAGVEMSEKDAVESTLLHSRELKRLEKRLESKKVRADYARFDVRNPEIRLSDISTKYADSAANAQLQVGLRWRLPKLGEMNEKIQSARCDLWDASVDLFKYRVKLTGEVRKAWNEQAALQSELDLAGRRQEIEVRRLDVVTKLVALGQVPFVKRIKAQTGVLKARRDLAAVRQGLEAVRGRLASLMGREGPVRVVASEMPVGAVDVEQILKVAQDARPEVEVARQRAALAQSRYRAEKLKLVPWLSSIEVAYHYERDKADWGELMFGVELPFFNWGRGQVKAAALAAESRESAAAAGIETIEQSIRDAWGRWDSARAGLEVLRSQTDETRQSVRAVMTEARRQAMPEDDILELELSDIELEGMLMDARRDYVEAFIDLCAAAGVDDFAGLSGN